MYHSHPHNTYINNFNILYNSFRLIGILKVFAQIHFAKICPSEDFGLKYEC